MCIVIIFVVVSSAHVCSAAQIKRVACCAVVVYPPCCDSPAFVGWRPFGYRIIARLGLWCDRPRGSEMKSEIICFGRECCGAYLMSVLFYNLFKRCVTLVYPSFSRNMKPRKLDACESQWGSATQGRSNSGPGRIIFFVCNVPAWPRWLASRRE